MRAMPHGGIGFRYRTGTVSVKGFATPGGHRQRGIPEQDNHLAAGLPGFGGAGNGHRE